MEPKPAGKSQRKRLQRQLEFYLGESNLRQDKFLQQAMDEQGFVPVRVFLSFNKLKALKATERMILDEAEKSSVMRVDRSRSCIAPKVVPAAGEDYGADARTIYIDSFGTTDDHDSLRRTFTKFGKVNLVSMPRFPQSKKFKGFGFVEFAEQDSAEKATAKASDADLRGIRVMSKRRWLEMKEQLKLRLSCPGTSGSSASARTETSMQSQAQGGGGDGDLPSSLPSYMPASSQGAPAGLPFGYNLLSQAGAKSDADAAQRQWKAAPMQPQFMFVGAGARPAGAETAKPGGGAQPSPSEGMRGMSFQDGGGGGAAGFQMLQADGKAPTAIAPAPVGLKLGQQGGTPASQISAAQFAASTGGLAMDTALLARVSGTDPSLMGSEEIKQIMRTPDLLSIYQKLQEEDDRRQRRLERNRASARVRREKKKGMVETYEAEVSKLESSLNMLKNHQFGTGNADELATALQYSSGEHLRHAQMSKDAKMELMARILGQHSRNTDAIRRANAENQALIAVASDNSDFSQALRSQLGLTEDQCRRLASLAIPASEEARKLDAIRKCFSALRAHDWLYVPGIETILHQSRNTMTPHQFQKFLSWSVENRPSIDQLQFVPTPSAPASEKDLTFIFSED